MSYNKETIVTQVADTKPIETIPLSESFKEDLIVLYERYAPRNRKQIILVIYIGKM